MPALNTPLVTPKFTLPNRLVFPAMSTSSGAPDGSVTDETLAFFRQRSQGFGLVVVEHSYVSGWGKAGPKMLSVSRDEDIPGLSSLSALLHQNGCRAHLQLDHGGGWTIPELQGVLDPLKNPEGRRIAASITDEQLFQVVEDFAAAAVRARQAGFDGVQIKACHVYLLGQFYSPLTNCRTEGRYSGATFQGRIQLTLDVLDAVRRAVGSDYPVSVRFAVQDYDEHGSTLEESMRAGTLLEAHGADILDLSGGPKHRFFHPSSKEPGWFGPDAQVIRRGLDIPVAVAGGVTAPEHAQALLDQGCADLVGVCRAAVRDPFWARSALSTADNCEGGMTP